MQSTDISKPTFKSETTICRGLGQGKMGNSLITVVYYVPCPVLNALHVDLFNP